MTDRNQITVEEIVIFELKASSVVLNVSVKGTSYFADDVAIKKAKEVSALVDAFKELGIPEDEVRLTNVIADSQSGIISKTSSAKYYLTVKCRDLDKLADALAIVTGGKNCELHRLDWQFRTDREKKLEEIAKVFSAAKETGECIASALGVVIEGVIDSKFEGFTVPDAQPGIVSNTAYLKMNTVASESSRARVDAEPSLPSGQWQKQGFKAKVIFQVGSKTATTQNS